MLYFGPKFWTKILDFYDKLSYHSIKKEDKLFKLFTIDNKTELNNLVKDEKLLSNYQKKLIDLSLDKNYWEDMMSEEREEFFKKQDAYLNGYDAGQYELILKMHDNNMPLEEISKYTELTLEEVKLIIDANKSNQK